MTSLQTSIRQGDGPEGYFIPVASCINKVYAYNATAGNIPFSSAVWAGAGSAAASRNASSLLAGGGLLRDLGKTIISSGRTFRKVQLVTSSFSTFGVAGSAGTSGYVEDYLTGYIEMGFEGPVPGNLTPVAKYGR